MANVTDEFNQTPVVQPEAKSRGCLYGCLFAVLAVVALTVCGGVATYWWVSNQIAKYTSDTPVALPKVEYTPEQLAELESRVETFQQAFKDGKTPEEDLVLTAEEINAMITAEEKLSGKVFVKIENGQVSGDLSIPTDALPGGKGRYFNGSASFNVSMENGILIVTLADAEVNEERVPQQFIDAMAAENLAKDLYKDPKNAEMLRRFESVSIEDDRIILKLRRDQDGEEGTETAETDASAEENAPEEDNAPGEASEEAPGDNAPSAEEPAEVSGEVPAEVSGEVSGEEPAEADASAAAAKS